MVLLYRSLLVAGSLLIAAGGWSCAAQAASQTTTTTTTAADDDDDTPKAPEKPNFVRTYDGKTSAAKSSRPVPVVIDDTTETSTTTATATAKTPAVDLTKKPIDEKARAYMTRGYESLRKGAYDPAIQDLEEALKIDKDSIVTRRYLVVALLAKQMPVQALDQLNIVAKAITPTSYDEQLFGDAYMVENANLDAAKSYADALKLDDRNDTARAGLARAYAYEGRFPDAFKIIQQGLDRNKNNPTWTNYFKALLKELSDLKSSPDPYSHMQKTPVGQPERPPDVMQFQRGNGGGG